MVDFVKTDAVLGAEGTERIIIQYVVMCFIKKRRSFEAYKSKIICIPSCLFSLVRNGDLCDFTTQVLMD